MKAITAGCRYVAYARWGCLYVYVTGVSKDSVSFKEEGDSDIYAMSISDFKEYIRY